MPSSPDPSWAVSQAGSGGTRPARVGLLERQIRDREHGRGGRHQGEEQRRADEEVMAHGSAACSVKNEIPAAHQDDEQDGNSNPVNDRHRAFLPVTMPVATVKMPLGT